MARLTRLAGLTGGSAGARFAAGAARTTLAGPTTYARCTARSAVAAPAAGTTAPTRPALVVLAAGLTGIATHAIRAGRGVQ
ncbi:hypothetical protein OQ800_21190 [Mycobacterium ulcerans]|nr:hypothetical protein [Mycobacterium ulcerans]